MTTIVKQRIAQVETKAEEECPRDLLGLLVGCKDEKTGARMPLQQIMDESMAFLLAGHETTRYYQILSAPPLSLYSSDRSSIHHSYLWVYVRLYQSAVNQHSTLMTWLLYALALNPQVDAKLYAELSEHSDKIKDRVPLH
jgi:cytochrome P450